MVGFPLKEKPVFEFHIGCVEKLVGGSVRVQSLYCWAPCEMLVGLVPPI